MSPRLARKRCREEWGAGLVEIMISIAIGMLLVLVIYEVYAVNEAQKRTITSGSDAQENASYALFLLGRDLSTAGNGLASAVTGGVQVLQGCAGTPPIPAIIDAGALAADPDTVTVFYGGSGTLSTPVLLLNTTASTGPLQIAAPVGFSAGDLIVTVQGANCTLSTIDTGGVAVNGATGIATLTQTPLAGSRVVTYTANVAAVVNLGQPTALSRVVYSVDTDCKTDSTKCTLRTQNLLPVAGPVNPVVSDVINLKAQYGLDTDNDGTIDAWQSATGIWSARNLPTQPASTWQQIRAIRIAVVTRSSEHERTIVSPATISMFHDYIAPDPLEVSMTVPDRHYRYKELETIVPLRNATFNSP